MLLYDLSRPYTKDRVESYWLPKIASANSRTPVLLAGNKQDLVQDPSDAEEFIERLVVKFPQVEMGIELSARYHSQLADLVYCAQRAVLYPVYPLYDQRAKELRPEYESALRRVFRMCDRNGDNYLDDAELERFQSQNFSVEITADDIAKVKEILMEEVSFHPNI